MILHLLLACTGPNTDKPFSDDTGDTSVDTDDTGDTSVDSGDSGDTGDTGSEGDVEGPDLPDCTPATGDGNLVALSGVVLAPEGPVAGSASSTLPSSPEDAVTDPELDQQLGGEVKKLLKDLGYTH